MKTINTALSLLTASRLLIAGEQGSLKLDKNVKVGLLVGVSALPSYPHPNIQHDALKDGETYGMALDMGSVAEPPPKALWIHRSRRTIPPLKIDEVKKLGRELGFEGKWDVIHENCWKTCSPDNLGYLAYSSQEDSMNMTYRAAAQSTASDRAFAVPLEACKVPWNSYKAFHDVGKTALVKLGLWPTNLTTNYYSGASGRGDAGGRTRTYEMDFEYWAGDIEGYPLKPSSCYGHMYRFCVTFAGELSEFEMNWIETERFAYLETCTVLEACDGLNRGFSMPLPKLVAGCKAQYRGLVYVWGPPSFKYVYPFYEFFLAGSGVVGSTVIVPAIDSKYFENPKRQIVLVGGPANEKFVKLEDDEASPGYTPSPRTVAALLKQSTSIVVGRLAKADTDDKWQIEDKKYIWGMAKDALVFFVHPKAKGWLGVPYARERSIGLWFDQAVGKRAIFFVMRRGPEKQGRFSLENPLEEVGAVHVEGEWFSTSQRQDGSFPWEIWHEGGDGAGAFHGRTEDLIKEVERCVKEQGHR